MSEHAVSERGVLMLAPGRAARHYRRDLWAYRELFAILAWPPSRITHRLSTVSFSPNSVATWLPSRQSLTPRLSHDFPCL
jgi:hypothetical protein